MDRTPTRARSTLSRARPAPRRNSTCWPKAGVTTSVASGSPAAAPSRASACLHRRRVRQELFGSCFLYNSGFSSPFGVSFNQDIRGQGEARTVVRGSRHDVASFGVTLGREQVKNSVITDAGFSTFPLQRNELAVYA